MERLKLFAGSLGGDDEDDGVARGADVERADNHRFTFTHADVCRYAGRLVIDRWSHGAIRSNSTTNLNRNACAKTEPLHLHPWLAIDSLHEFHLPDTEIAKARIQYWCWTCC